MENILNEYRQYLNEIISRHPMSKGGTFADMQELLQRIKALHMEYRPAAVAKGKELLDSAPNGIDKVELEHKIVQTMKEVYNSHVPENLAGIGWP